MLCDVNKCVIWKSRIRYSSTVIHVPKIWIIHVFFSSRLPCCLWWLSKQFGCIVNNWVFSFFIDFLVMNWLILLVALFWHYRKFSFCLFLLFLQLPAPHGSLLHFASQAFGPVGYSQHLVPSGVLQQKGTIQQTHLVHWLSAEWKNCKNIDATRTPAKINYKNNRKHTSFQ